MDFLFHCLSPYFPNFHILLHCLFFLLNINLFMVFFNLIFWGAFPRDGFTCFIYAIFYFLSIAEHCVTKFHQSSVCSSSISFFTPIFQCQFLVTCHTHRPIFNGGSGSCDFLNIIWIIYVWFNFKCFIILLIINI